jgi:four helix bundle protein
VNAKQAKNFRDLIVWQKAHELVLEIYKLTRRFPKEEMYGLTLQFRRAAVSITANIAEGFPKKSNQDKLRYYNIAQGSLSECYYYLILAKDLNYHYDENLFELIQEIGKLLNSYMKAIKQNF